MSRVAQHDTAVVAIAWPHPPRLLDYASGVMDRMAKR